jgi:hypothetical protein
MDLTVAWWMQRDIPSNFIGGDITGLRLFHLANPVLLPGIKINTSPTNYHPIRQLQLMRWAGKTWELFGDVISDASA